MAPPPITAALGGLVLWLGFFAGWTLGSVPLVLACAPVSALWLACGTGMAGAALAWTMLRPRLAAALLDPAALPARLSLPQGRGRLIWILGLPALALAGLVFVPTSNALPFWAVAVVLGLAALGDRERPPAPPVPEPPATGGGGALALLALVILGLYVVILRPDADDAFYLNLPLGLLADPGCMMGRDTMYGAADWPILGSNYRVEALPTLVAALSGVTGLPVVTVAHLLLPAVWCLAWAATLAVIGHGLFGRRWWLFAGLAVLVPMALAGTLQGWGVHGVARLFHGKGPLILIVIPLIAYVAARSAAAGTATPPVFAALCGLSTIALGLTANAIYLAPLTVLVAVVAAQLAWPRGLGRMAVLVLAAAPPVAAGLWLLLFDRPVSADEPDGLARAADLALWGMAGSKLTLAVVMATLAAALVAARAGPAGRWIAAFLVLFLLLVLNPLLWPLYDRFVTGGLSFRLWWALPLPAFLAAALTWAALRSGRAGPVAAAMALALGVMALLPSGLIGMDGTALRPSLQKIPADLAPVLQEIRDAAPADGTVLAPEEIATWLPTRAGHPALVYTRRLYFAHSAPVVAPDRLAPRVLLADWVAGAPDLPRDEIGAALAALDVRLVVLPADAPVAEADLAALGATPVPLAGGYALFRLPDPRE